MKLNDNYAQERKETKLKKMNSQKDAYRIQYDVNMY